MTTACGQIVIGVIDVGSPKSGKLGGAVLGPDGSTAVEARGLLCGDAPYRSAIDELDVFSLLGAGLLRPAGRQIGPCCPRRAWL